MSQYAFKLYTSRIECKPIIFNRINHLHKDRPVNLFKVTPRFNSFSSGHYKVRLKVLWSLALQSKEICNYGSTVLVLTYLQKYRIQKVHVDLSYRKVVVLCTQPNSNHKDYRLLRKQENRAQMPCVEIEGFLPPHPCFLVEQQMLQINKLCNTLHTQRLMMMFDKSQYEQVWSKDWSSSPIREFNIWGLRRKFKRDYWDVKSYLMWRK